MTRKTNLDLDEDLEARGQEIKTLQITLSKFAKERDWEQFHSPKNLVMALTGEVGELVECFQWLKEEESFSPDKLDEVKDEMADVFLYLIRLADILEIDLFECSRQKIKKNEKKYPKDKVKGSNKKYNEYDQD